jgi:uncharacterized repeat protein (TIGR01451 family)
VEHKNIKIGFILAAAFGLVFSFFNPGSVGAQYYSQNDLKKIVTIDKKIRLMKENILFDNIPSSKYTFVDGDTIEFEIVVTNAGNEDLTGMTFSDVLPQYLSLVFSPGSVDKNSNTINWDLEKLLPGQSKTYVIRAKISGVESIGVTAMKLTNKVNVVSGNVNDKDNASYYVAKKMVPTTGDDSLPVKTALLVSGGVLALYLRKLARGF